jgi:hypothetical protein
VFYCYRIFGYVSLVFMASRHRDVRACMSSRRHSAVSVATNSTSVMAMVLAVATVLEEVVSDGHLQSGTAKTYRLSHLGAVRP